MLGHGQRISDRGIDLIKLRLGGRDSAGRAFIHLVNKSVHAESRFDILLIEIHRLGEVGSRGDGVDVGDLGPFIQEGRSRCAYVDTRSIEIPEVVEHVGRIIHKIRQPVGGGLGDSQNVVHPPDTAQRPGWVPPSRWRPV